MKHWWILFLLSCYLVILLSCCVWQTKAVGIDTLTVYSPSMRKNVDALVLCPAGYSPTKKYPVVYLLHGYSDAWNNGWLKKCDGLEALIDHYEMIVVCPDGGFSSWYYDSPEDPSYKYETFITRELIPAVDSRFGTVADRTGRAVAYGRSWSFLSCIPPSGDFRRSRKHERGRRHSIFSRSLGHRLTVGTAKPISRTLGIAYDNQYARPLEAEFSSFSV